MWVRHRCSVAVVPNSFDVRGSGVEGFGHVGLGELFECSSLHAEEVKGLVDLWDVGNADAFEDVVGERRAAWVGS